MARKDRGTILPKRRPGGPGEGMLTLADLQKASPATRALAYKAKSALGLPRGARELVASPGPPQRLAAHTLNFQQR